MRAAGGRRLAGRASTRRAAPSSRPIWRSRTGIRRPDRDLLRVSQWVDLVSSQRALVDELHTVFSRDYRPNKLHKFLAELPGTLREQGAAICGQLVLTTNYDDVLERAFSGGGGAGRRGRLRDAPGRAAVRAPEAGRRARADRRPGDVPRVRARGALGDPEDPRRRRPRGPPSATRSSSPRTTTSTTWRARACATLIPTYLMRAARRARPALPRLFDARLEPARDPAADLGRAGDQHGRLVDPAQPERDRQAVLGAAADRRSSTSRSRTGSTGCAEQLG